MNKNAILNMEEKLKQLIYLNNPIFGDLQICSVYLFSAAIYKLIFVLHLGALSHSRALAVKINTLAYHCLSSSLLGTFGTCWTQMLGLGDMRISTLR